MEAMPEAMPEASIKKSPGHLILKSKELPEIKNWKVGKQYHLHLVVEQKAIRESYDKKDEYEADFDVVKAMVMKGGMVDKEEYDKMSDEERDKTDEKEVLEEKE